MNNFSCKILSSLALTAFIAYWIFVFILATPPNRVKTAISDHLPRFKKIFGHSWNLFTPVPTYNNRLYFLVRDIRNHAAADTIEVLENISRRKQLAAPFNQRENIIDHLVQNSVGLLKIVVRPIKVSPTGQPVTDSLQIARATSGLATSNNYRIFLGTLFNYCKLVLKERNIDTTGKEVKIVIKEKMMRPFNERNNENFLQKETVFFETPYTPLHP